MASSSNAGNGPVKRLYRSRDNQQLAGVCAGIATYFDLDPTVVRLGWVILTIVTGIVPGIIAYIIAAIVMPLEDSQEKEV